MLDRELKLRALVKPGAALKALRTERGWSLAELSRRTGLPVSSLSKVENDKMDLTLDKLLRVSNALEFDLSGLFTQPNSQDTQSEASGRRIINRVNEGKHIETATCRFTYLAYEMLNKHSIPIIMDVTAKEVEEFGEWNKHPGEEFVYVIEGVLDFYSKFYLPVSLSQGESMYFDSNMGHAYVAGGEGPCRILSICIAPEHELVSLMQRKQHGSQEPVLIASSA